MSGGQERAGGVEAVAGEEGGVGDGGAGGGELGEEVGGETSFFGGPRVVEAVDGLVGTQFGVVEGHGVSGSRTGGVSQARGRFEGLVSSSRAASGW